MRDLSRYTPQEETLTVKAALEDVKQQATADHQSRHLRLGLEALEKAHQHFMHAPDTSHAWQGSVSHFLQGLGQEDPTPSMEGFGDVVRKVKETFRKETKEEALTEKASKPYGAELRRALETLRKAVKQFYLNDRWLQQQTFVNAPVPAGGINDGLVFKDMVWADPHALCKTAFQAEQQFAAKYNHAIGTYRRSILDIHETVQQRHKRGDDLKTVFTDAIAAVNKLKLPEDVIGTTRVDLLGNTWVTVTRGKDTPILVHTKKFPKGEKVRGPLNVKTTKEYGEVMLAVIDTILPNKVFELGTFVDHTDGDPLWGTAQEVAPNEMNDYLDETSTTIMEDRYDNPQVEVTEAKLRLLSALEHWIDRSIK